MNKQTPLDEKKYKVWIRGNNFQTRYSEEDVAQAIQEAQKRLNKNIINKNSLWDDKMLIKEVNKIFAEEFGSLADNHSQEKFQGALRQDKHTDLQSPDNKSLAGDKSKEAKGE